MKRNFALAASIAALMTAGICSPFSMQVFAETLPQYEWKKEFTQSQGPNWYYYQRSGNDDTLLSAESEPVYGFDEDGNFQSGTRFTGDGGLLGAWNGSYVCPGENADIALVFRVPRYGTVDLSFILRAASTGGDGQRVRVCLNGEKIYPAESDWLVHTYRDDAVEVTDLAVGQNDTIEIIVNKNKSFGADICYMNPVIRYTELTKGVEVAESKIIVKTGEKIPLTVTTTEEGLAVNFVSSDDSVAAVDDEGVITGVACGDATISVSVDGSNVTRTVCVAVVEEKSLVHRWSEEFSRAQGPNWFYEQKIGGVYKRLVCHGNPAFGGAYEDGTAGEGYMFIPPVYYNTPQNQYLGVWNGVFVHPAEQSDAAICFRVPYSGILNWRAHVGRKLNGSDGQSVSVWLNGDKIYPLEGKAVNNEAFDIALSDLKVMRGDNIRFVVNKNGNLSADSCFVDIVAEYTAYYEQPSRDAVKMDGTELVLKEGQLSFLDYSIILEYEGEIPEERFSSSDSSVLFINSVGFMKAKSKGTAVITITLESGVSFMRTVRVE